MTPSLSQCWEDPLYQLDLVFLLQDEEFFLLDVKLCCVEHGLLWDKPYQLGPHHREIQHLKRTSETGEKGHQIQEKKAPELPFLPPLPPQPGGSYPFPGPGGLMESLQCGSCHVEISQKLRLATSC